MIQAINKQGVIGTFSEVAWKLLGASKNGWVEYDGIEKSINVPKQIIEFQAKKKEAATAVNNTIVEETVLTLENLDISSNWTYETEAMKAHLTEKGIKFHHKIGYDKLKQLYDDNQK